MILSVRHRFIFVRGRKVAGTSVEMALSTICGPDDIVTPLIPVDEFERQRMNGRCGNYSDQPLLEEGYLRLVRAATPEQLARLSKPPASKYYTHMPLKDVIAEYGRGIDDFRVICVERSPYARVLSGLNMKQSFADYEYDAGMQAPVEDLPRLLDEALASGTIQRLRNMHLYRDASGAMRARALRYETLRADLDAFTAELGLTRTLPLPHAKKGLMSNALDTMRLLRPDQIAAINDIFAEEFDAFGYPRLQA